ncbi:MAG: hypothetical protein WC350_04765 [Candidatus Micrarchaeia archaeon]
MSGKLPSDQPTKVGLPPVRSGLRVVRTPPVPSHAQRNALRNTPPVDAPAANMPARQPARTAEQDAKEKVTWLLTNAELIKTEADIRKFAESIVSCKGTQEESTRIEYVMVMASDGRYRLYDSRGDAMSNEKYGILFATLELRGARFLLYKENPRRPWPE